MKTKILVVEDDTNIRFGLVELLSSEGYATESCERGNLALAAVERHRPSLVVLDIMLPGMNGYEVCKQLRDNGYRGLILMLTAKSQEMDKVIGLESGADDYVTKPFGLRELTARVHALLRRSRAAEDHAEERLTAGDLILDLKTFELKRGDASVSLSAREVKLLQFLLDRERSFPVTASSTRSGAMNISRTLGSWTNRSCSSARNFRVSAPTRNKSLRYTLLGIDGSAKITLVQDCRRRTSSSCPNCSSCHHK